MHELVFGFPACMLDGGYSRFRGDAVTLIVRQNQPANFVNCLVPPALSPIANVANAFPIRDPNDPEHVIYPVFRLVQVTLVAPQDLFGAFRSTEVLHHCRVAQEFLKQLQVRF